MNQFNSRNTDPVTSFAAGAKVSAFASRHYAKIDSCLREFGPMGKDGIAKVTGLTGVAVARRLPEMSACVRPTGRKVMSDTGNFEREWEAM